jgi:DNA (cytosine-5)-methyltransferase 1
MPLRKQRHLFHFVDLFAGVGGFRLALEQLGGKCVYSVEIDRFAQRTYAANFAACDEADIANVEHLPEHEVLVAGFPCQPFSLAGVSKRVSLGRAHGFLDIRHGNLFFQIARLVELSRPQVILLENVKNLVTHDRGKTFDLIMSTLEGLGYAVQHRVIDARHWVPQHRERTFIVGLRKDLYGTGGFIFPAEPKARPTLGVVLQRRAAERYYLSKPLWKYLQAYAKKHREAGNGFGFGLFGPNDVARTLSARYYKDGSEVLIRTPRSLPRRLTPRECARLMGFPDSFKIVVSDAQAYRQFGNAVVVPIVRHLGKALIKQAGLGGEQLGLPLSSVRPVTFPGTSPKLSPLSQTVAS